MPALRTDAYPRELPSDVLASTNCSNTVRPARNRRQAV